MWQREKGDSHSKVARRDRGYLNKCNLHTAPVTRGYPPSIFNVVPLGIDRQGMFTHQLAILGRGQQEDQGQGGQQAVEPHAVAMLIGVCYSQAKL